MCIALWAYVCRYTPTSGSDHQFIFRCASEFGVVEPQDACGMAGGQGEDVDAVEFKWPLEVFSRYLFVTSERHRDSGELNRGPGWYAEIWWRD